MASAYAGTCLMPPLFGLIANHITASLFPVYLLRDNPLPQPDHPAVAQLHGQKAAQGPANRNAGEKQAGGARRTH